MALLLESANTIISVCKALNISSDFLFEDLIQSTNSKTLNDLMSQSFVENYLKFNNYNRVVLEALAAELVKLQKSY